MKIWVILVTLIIGISLNINGQKIDTALLINDLDSLYDLADELQKNGKALEALPIAKNAANETAQKLGKFHPKYSPLLNLVAVCHYRLGQLNEVEPLFIENLEIQERISGKQNAFYAMYLNNLGVLYLDLRKFEKAEVNLIGSKIIRQDLLGKKNLDYIGSLKNLGALYDATGDYNKAEAYYLEGLSILADSLKMKNKEYVSFLGNLENLYSHMGLYSEVEKICIQDSSIRFDLYGNNHPEFYRSLKTLANTYTDQGNFYEAEKLIIRIINFQKKQFGSQHPNYAGALMNLSVLYSNMLLHESAEPIYNEVKEIYFKVFGAMSSKYADCLNNLGILYLKTNRLKQSKLFLEKSINIRAKIFGKLSLEYAKSLKTLANTFLELKDYRRAKSNYIKALSIEKKVLGINHLDYASTLGNLGTLYLRLGKFKEAEQFFLQSKNIKKEMLGTHHYSYIISLINLSALYQYSENFQKSDSFSLYASTEINWLFTHAVRFLSEKELYNFKQFFINELDNQLSYALFRSKNIEQLSPIILDNILFYKGLDLQKYIFNRNRAQLNPSTAKILDRITFCHHRLYNEYVKPITSRDSNSLANLEQETNDLEKLLARELVDLGEVNKSPRWQEIQNKLKDDQSTIEFIRFEKTFPKTTDSIYYAALILRPDYVHPYFVPLFEERKLTQLLDCKGLDINECLSRTFPNSKASSLYNLIIKPLEPYLIGVKTLIFSPAGLLYKINLGAFGFNGDSVLSQKYKLVQLGSTRQLIGRDSIYADTTQSTAYLFGGIQYEMDSTAISNANAKLDTVVAFATRGSSELQFRFADSTLQFKGFNYLQGTAEEINNIQALIRKQGLSVNTFSGFEATEEAFKLIGLNSKPPRILHLATHGFFFPDQINKNDGRLAENDQPVFKMSDHPMIRSGLIMAGGNQAWKSVIPNNSRMEDGILTAYEISQSNLRGTELVVLSACETGLGEIESNEGVYGLQRAFKIAGVRYLMMSLWSVPDQATQEFMTLFYQKWLSEKLLLPDAFRNTQLDMRIKYPSKPLNWAGWVLVE
ncbi:MAG: CHAT domain-containing protein [Saprospiraceae bacterium]|nr:CHAT domain-containing protein [Saprospiraceae bacterium]